MDEIRVWALSSYGGNEVTVRAPSALEAIRLVERRASEGDKVAAAAIDPDRVELIVVAEVS